MTHDNFPFVSIIIPTLNMRDLLRDAIASLYRQDYPKDRYEIIIVDNSSTDGTEDMVRSLQEKSQYPLWYYRKENKGPGSSRNLGIEKAKGTIIAFTDSDCVADAHWLKNGVAGMSDEVGLVQGKTLPNPAQPRGTFSRTQSVTHETGMYPMCNIFYRKDVLEQVGGIAPDFCGLNCFGKPRWGGEDTDLAWRVKERGWKSVFADEAIIYHHIFPLRPWQAVISFRGYQYQGLFFAIPYLLKKHPELRSHMFYRFFLSKKKALFDIFLLSLLSGILIHQVFLLFTVPYIAESKDAFLGRPIKQYHRGVVIVITRVFSDLVDFILLLGGSIWNRSIIL
jgi:cellulose synthase/poly-beta-1,6-N-acetylglucosamine synthase-like glycosyltransferase